MNHSTGSATARRAAFGLVLAFGCRHHPTDVEREEIAEREGRALEERPCPAGSKLCATAIRAHLGAGDGLEGFSPVEVSGMVMPLPEACTFLSALAHGPTGLDHLPSAWGRLAGRFDPARLPALAKAASAEQLSPAGPGLLSYAGPAGGYLMCLFEGSTWGCARVTLEDGHTVAVHAESGPMGMGDRLVAPDAGVAPGPPPCVAPPPRASLRVASTQGTGGRSTEVLEDVVASRLDRLRGCYDRALQANPAAAGHVAVRYLIDPEGIVADAQAVSSDLPDAAASSCIVQVFRELRFPHTRRQDPAARQQATTLLLLESYDPRPLP